MADNNNNKENLNENEEDTRESNDIAMTKGNAGGKATGNDENDNNNDVKEDTIDTWLGKHGLSEFSTILKKHNVDLATVAAFQQQTFLDVLQETLKNEGKDEIVPKLDFDAMGKFVNALSTLRASQLANEKKKWAFEDVDKFVGQLETELGRFKKANEITKPTFKEKDLIQGTFMGRGSMAQDLSQVLIERLKHHLNCQQTNSHKDRSKYPISGIVGCPGAGKTAMLAECYKIFMNGFGQRIEKILDESKENDGNSKMNGLSPGDKARIVKQFENTACISISYTQEPIGLDSANTGNSNDNNNNNKNKMNDNVATFRMNVGFLWRILFEIIDGGNTNWVGFCEKLKSFANSEDLGYYTVSKILSKIYPNRSIFLLIEVYKNGRQVIDMLHTCAQLMMLNCPFIHCVAACLVDSPFDKFVRQAGRPVARLDCNLFDIELLLDIFEKDIKYVKKYEADNLTQFVSMILDTIGLPRMVEYLLEAFEESGKKVGATKTLFEEKVYDKYGAIPKRNLKFIKTLLGQRSGFGGGCTDVKISPDYDDTWDDMQARGFIKIEEDGVYMSPLILGPMMDDDCKEIKCLVDTCVQVGINLIGLNEQLMGQVFKGYKMAYIRYFNLTSCWWKISRNLRDCVVCVEPLKLGDTFKEKNTIDYAKNDNDKDAGIDAIINREDMHWMLSNTTIDMKKLDEMMAGFSKQVGKRKKESKLEYTFVIAGEFDAKNDDDTENLDSKYGFVLLTGKGMQLHLLPLLRRRVLPAAFLAQIIGD